MNRLFATGAILTMLLNSVAFAHDDEKTTKHEKTMMGEMKAMTPEQREKMASAHEKMAVCLRSDKPLKDCHDEMKKTCRDVMGGECPMMKHGGKMKKEIKETTETKEVKDKE